MELYEAKLAKYLQRKYPNEHDPLPASVLDIQAYAAAENVFAKSSGVTPPAIYSYLLSAPFSSAFVFWHACYCERLRSETTIPPDEV